MIFLIILIFIIPLSQVQQTPTLNGSLKRLNKTKTEVTMKDIINPAVIGGYPASLKEFPYAVRLYAYDSGMLIMCTGEAVHKRLVLTAAHCVEGGGSMLIVTGDSDQTDFIKGKNVDKYALYKVVEVFIHPKFDNIEYIHDVAILKTGRDMLHPGHGVISVSYEKLQGPVNVTIFGWGGTENNRNNNQLYGKHLSAKNCSLTLSKNSIYQYICLMDKGVCHGDSGGGLIHNGAVIGIASFYTNLKALKCLKDDIYYYTAMAEEMSFVKHCIEKNGNNYKHNFQFIILVVFILEIFLYHT